MFVSVLTIGWHKTIATLRDCNPTRDPGISYRRPPHVPLTFLHAPDNAPLTFLPDNLSRIFPGMFPVELPPLSQIVEYE